ncbi:MAG: succinate dehydrogenase cytochrome b subunit [Acidimicrobiales bacterium]|nr:succinate dehydrogenase cytochrome b subunit [Acidimicrobiales bacterium]
MATTMDRTGAEPVHPRPTRRAPWPVEFYRSGVGKKWVMAITGLLLMGFVFFHSIGNLKVYLGAEDFNHYGEFLREILVPILPRTIFLWLMRLGLIAAFAFHIHAAWSLTRMNQRANADGYQQSRDWQAATAASRSMRWTGVVVALFVVFHLFDLTWGTANPDYVRGDGYRNLVASFSRTPVAIFYLLANAALVIHLFHGAWSLFQSLGLNNPRWNAWRKHFAIAFAALIGVMNLSFPLAVMTGLVSADDNDACTKRGDVIERCTEYEEAHP